jgi:formylglycine-generating enzyme required for sulfatase activity
MFLGSAVLSLGLACEQNTNREAERVATERAAAERAATGEDKPATESKAVAPVGPKEIECPLEMVKVSGGDFWVGTEREVFDREENPQFLARVATFCVDRLEVSTAEYETCVSEGKCTPPAGVSYTCNSVKKGRGDHPINCIDHAQAQAVCQSRNARLPTEVEWEYIARGGAEMRAYSWGDAHPDGNTCWKSSGTCKRGVFSEEAFGLRDVTGNVWEWTDSWFAPYPWPSETGRHKVYRGGGWSRRFEKWLRPTLRNRLDPKQSGSHLGVRCAHTPDGTPCPEGAARTGSGGCYHGILQVKCLDKHEWNGVRCAPVGDPERCPPHSREVPGLGCVRATAPGAAPATKSQSLDLQAVSRSRSPEFDADCAANNAARPRAYRYTGGGHVERNIVGKNHGCKNRDVGVGFNSACCPE